MQKGVTVQRKESISVISFGDKGLDWLAPGSIFFFFLIQLF